MAIRVLKIVIINSKIEKYDENFFILRSNFNELYVKILYLYIYNIYFSRELKKLL